MKWIGLTGGIATGKSTVARLFESRDYPVVDADQIVVLNKGEIAEVGTHNELVAMQGIYYGLVKNQLELGS